MSKPFLDLQRARDGAQQSDGPLPRFSHLIGRSRFVVLFAVLAVMLVAMTLFLLGIIQTALAIWHAAGSVWRGQMSTTNLTVEFLEIVSTMLKAVVFYLIGVGFYGLFITPLNLTVSLGVESLSDLESEVISVVIVILAVTFLEHFIRWEQPRETLQFGAGLALVVGVLVLFQHYNHRVKEAQRAVPGNMQARAQHELFEADQEKHEVKPD